MPCCMIICRVHKQDAWTQSTGRVYVPVFGIPSLRIPLVSAGA